MSSLEELINKVELLDERARQLQSADDLEYWESEWMSLRSEYIEWFTSCLSLIPAEMQGRFRVEYDGSITQPKIQKFLGEPKRANPFRGESGQLDKLLSVWLYPYEKCFRDPIWEQKSILIEALKKSPVVPSEINALAKIRLIADRFPTIINHLKSRHADRPALTVEDEYDVQYLLHALLRLFFDDIRTEEYTERYGAKNYRMDVLLKQEEIVVEVKKTRANLNGARIQEELAVDIEAYRNHSSCKHLVAFIYDPDGFIENPKGWAVDLNGPRGSGINVEVLVV